MVRAQVQKRKRNNLREYSGKVPVVMTRRLKKSWEIIADNLSKAGWSWGCVSAIWIADAHRDDGKRFVVRADEKLTELRFDHTLICRERAGSHGKAYASYRGVPFNDCFLRNSHARALIESATTA